MMNLLSHIYKLFYHSLFMFISSYYALQSIPNLSKCNLMLYVCVCVYVSNYDTVIDLTLSKLRSNNAENIYSKHLSRYYCFWLVSMLYKYVMYKLHATTFSLEVKARVLTVREQ